MEPLRIFVYGTLKSGQSRHRLVGPNVVQLRPATIRGRLYHIAAGYPMLIIAQEDVFAVGSNDLEMDLAAQARHQPAAAHDWITNGSESSDWSDIQGELIWLTARASLLSRLDRYEGYSPGEHSLFRRVLTTVSSLEPITAWTYVSPTGNAPPNASRIGAWPE